MNEKLTQNLLEISARQKKYKELCFERYQKDRSENGDGGGTYDWIDNLRRLANTAYLLNGDIATFRKNHIEAGKVLLELFERAQKGPVGDGSFTKLTRYADLMCILAAGDFETGQKVATCLLGKENNKMLRPFGLYIGQAVRDMVLKKDKRALDWAQKLEERCQKEAKSFSGFAVAIQGIAVRDSKRFHEGLAAFLKSFKRIASAGGTFIGEEKYICLWGLGLANWAEHLGITVDIEHPYLPAELIIRRK